MKSPQTFLISYFERLQEKTIGLWDIYVSPDDEVLDIEVDARYDLFAPHCIFDDCKDQDATMLLAAFAQNNLNIGWTVHCQFAKLLAKRGTLIRDLIEPILATQDWSSLGSHALLLSYLPHLENGEEQAIKLLDIVPEDQRDGLFLACHYLRSEKLDHALREKFILWDKAGWTGGETGELGALQQFIANWLPHYPIDQLEAVIQIFFKHSTKS